MTVTTTLLALFQAITFMASPPPPQDKPDQEKRHREILRELQRELVVAREWQTRWASHMESLAEGLKEQAKRNDVASMRLIGQVQDAQSEFLPAIDRLSSQIYRLNENMERQIDSVKRSMDYLLTMLLSIASGTFILRQTKYGTKVLGDRRVGGAPGTADKRR